MLALVPTFVDLPLSTRAAAAVNAISTYPLTIPQRFELVALAVWPTDSVLPGRVRRHGRRDLGRRWFPARGAAVGVGHAAEFDVPWLTARGWIRRAS